jgi:hypothetical protein
METLVSIEMNHSHTSYNGYNGVDINSNDTHIIAKSEIKPVTIFSDDMARRTAFVNELVSKFESNNSIVKLPKETMVKKLIERAVHWCLVNGIFIIFLYI